MLTEHPVHPAPTRSDVKVLDIEASLWPGVRLLKLKVKLPADATAATPNNNTSFVTFIKSLRF
jgi:hypothetical protein